MSGIVEWSSNRTAHSYEHACTVISDRPAHEVDSGGSLAPIISILQLSKLLLHEFLLQSSIMNALAICTTVDQMVLQFQVPEPKTHTRNTN